MEHIVNENSKPRYPVGDFPPDSPERPGCGEGTASSRWAHAGMSNTDSGSGSGIEVREELEKAAGNTAEPCEPHTVLREEGLGGEAEAACTQNCREPSSLPCGGT